MRFAAVRSLALALLAAVTSDAGGPTHAVGEIVDPVVCAAAPGQSYALYLPTGYTSEKAWPVLYLLDPRGRGRLAVEIYREAAERYGYLLVGSNDTRSDEEPQPNFDAMQAMLDDTFASYALDPGRLYVAGMSGGARAACEIAARAAGRVRGLILVGASCARDPRLEEGAAIDFFSVVGEADFNYREVQQFDDRLGRLDLSHRLVAFDGPHGWHGRVEADRALEWLELRAMARGLRSEDTAFVDLRLDTVLAGARNAEREGRPALAWEIYRELMLTFDGLRPLGEIGERFAELGREAEVKRSIRRRRSLLREEARRIRRAERVLLALDGPDPRPGARVLAERLGVDRLRTEMREGPRDRSMLARRLLETIFVEVSFYIPARLRAAGDAAGAKLSLELAAEIRAAAFPIREADPAPS